MSPRSARATPPLSSTPSLPGLRRHHGQGRLDRPGRFPVLRIPCPRVSRGDVRRAGGAPHPYEMVYGRGQGEVPRVAEFLFEPFFKLTRRGMTVTGDRPSPGGARLGRHGHARASGERRPRLPTHRRRAAGPAGPARNTRPPEGLVPRSQPPVRRRDATISERPPCGRTTSISFRRA